MNVLLHADIKTFEGYIREQIAKKQGISDPSTIRLDEALARAMREELLNQLLNKYIDEVERQNKDYFEGKAKDLLEMRK